ncbi:Glycoside hydrolase, 38 vacuolar alpha mannosidase [Coemansia sp. RSA 2050]|nr:Glycoside hydrolase, 38 vacuolar alpha mannosidase [Coemansia sp. RSA 2050]KAJ2736676.1 Glycoside hydrolase, 38 vacuolar alpha mannosidase [Coemansia sp. BCRC 34962]
MDRHMSYVQKHPNMTKDRLAHFMSNNLLQDVNLRAAMYDGRVSGSPHVKLEIWAANGLERPTFAEAIKQEYKPAKVGHMFGPSWASHWVRATLQIPEEFAGKEVRLLFNPSCEAMVWSEAGEPLQGITGGNAIDMHVDHIVTKCAPQASEPLLQVVLYLEVASNGMFGNGNDVIAAPKPDRQFELKTADLVVYNHSAWAMFYDLQILKDLAAPLPDTPSVRAWQALATANAMVNAFELGDPDSIAEARAIGAQFFAAKGGEANHQVYAIGNCHIDTAWLWPYDETKRKIARSWSTQMDYMDRYPEYKFAASQAQQFEWLRVLYPTLFERLKEKVKCGQFIPIGATWCEFDANLPSGESLVRQFLLGQRYFEKHFGERSKVFWLPDTFGYSSQLPQIVRLAGAKYFFTQKLSWNSINKFPHTTFRWIGLDGSQVLTHMAPSETYVAQVTANELVDSLKKHKDIAYSNESLYLYGNGDGGGGPLEAMMERMRRVEDVDGLPRVKNAHPNEFYEHVEKTAKELVAWKGELYFELHRGTYTSQALTKKYNRQCEFLLRDVEMLSVIAQTADSGFAYPADELTRMWQQVCLNQFHDVIPGSSIEIVYKDSTAIYEEVVASAVALKQQALSVLVASSTDALHATGLAVVNTSSWARTEVIAVPGLAQQAGGVQQMSKRDNVALVLATVPGCSVHPVDLSAQAAAVEQVAPVCVIREEDGSVVLQNAFVAARISADGRLTSLLDLQQQRELVPSGASGNVLELYDDLPIYWDAWDIEIYSQEKVRLVEGASITVVDEGPLVASVAVEAKVGKASSIRQWISLSASSARLDFDCGVDWHENRKCLKVAFTWDIYSDQATYETQFGVVQRPTHRNTTWDMAKFEVCAHKFADLSEYGYGVALLNDCKYGYSTLANTMTLSLLRSPKAPDANCDMGQHSFRYAVYPHTGMFNESDVVREAYHFNVALSHLPVDLGATNLAALSSFFALDNAPNVVLDSVKAAEDDTHDVVVRLYEAYGGHARTILSTSLNVGAAYTTNILEEKEADLELRPAVAPIQGQSVTLNFRPFQIVTVRFSANSC